MCGTFVEHGTDGSNQKRAPGLASSYMILHVEQGVLFSQVIIIEEIQNTFQLFLWDDYISVTITPNSKMIQAWPTWSLFPAQVEHNPAHLNVQNVYVDRMGNTWANFPWNARCLSCLVTASQALFLDFVLLSKQRTWHISQRQCFITAKCICKFTTTEIGFVAEVLELE